MRKFIIKIVVYFLTLCVITIGINELYVKCGHPDTDGTEKFQSIPDDIQVCNFGSSHGLFGYNYDDIEDEYVCFNFALSSQSLSYDYRIMQYYQEHLKEGCLVFITVSYFSLIGKPEVEQKDFESKNKRYYKILPKEYIKQYDATTDFYVNKKPALDLGIDWISDEIIKKLQDNTSSEGDTTADTTANTMDYWEANAEAAYLRHLVTNKVDDDGNFIVNQEEIDALYDMIEMCHEKDWIPVLITTPFINEYTSRAYERSPELMEWFSETLNEIAENTGATYYDYSRDSRFSNRYDLFGDSDHMNEEGAREFVDILRDEIIDAY
jgi:hypothetical protein